MHNVGLNRCRFGRIRVKGRVALICVTLLSVARSGLRVAAAKARQGL
jgi:hypothetical protein